jgi:hypothetical protein
MKGRRRIEPLWMALLMPAVFLIAFTLAALAKAGNQ